MITIHWHQNPLRTVVELDDASRRALRTRLERDYLGEVIHDVRRRLQAGRVDQLEAVLVRVDQVDDEVDQQVDEYLRALRDEHCGDCTCVPASCMKCHAEEAVGVDTIAGLYKHVANHVRIAFEVDAERTIDQAIDALAHYQDPAPWVDHHDTWLACLPRWRAEAHQAHAWLVAYRAERFPPHATTSTPETSPGDA